MYVEYTIPHRAWQLRRPQTPLINHMVTYDATSIWLLIFGMIVNCDCSLAPAGSNQSDRAKYSPAIQRQKRAQKLRDIRTPSHPVDTPSQLRPQANLHNEKQYTSITESMRLSSTVEERSGTDGMFLQKWDDDKVFDHPIHR